MRAERDTGWARSQLGLALVLMAARFADLADPSRPSWLVGYAAASAGTGLAVAAALDRGPRRWWRPLAVAGAGAFQVGLVLGWSEPMDVTAAGPSLPVLLCAAGGLVVALALWLAPAGSGDARWPGVAAVGAAVGYGATLVGGARLLAFDLAEHVDGGAAIDGWLVDLAPVVVVTLLATPLALGAATVAARGAEPGRSTAALVALAAVPLVAAGDGWTGLAVAATAVLAGVAARHLPGAVVPVAVASVVLAGTALAAPDGPLLAVLPAAAYGTVVGAVAGLPGLQPAFRRSRA